MGFAQTGRVSGEVIVKKGAFIDPVVNGQVYLLYEGELTYSTRTDHDGHFQFREVTPGEYTLVVQHVVHGQSEEKEVVVRRGRITEVKVEMEG